MKDRLVLLAAVIAVSVASTAILSVEWQRAFDECQSFGGLERTHMGGISAQWSWSQLDFVCVFEDATGRVVERMRPPLGWDLERRQPPG